MRPALGAVPLLLVAAGAFASTPTPAQEREIMAAMQAWIAAVDAQDIASLRTILHDELLFIHSDARTQGKDEVLKDVEAGRGAAGVELSETVVRIYGNTALVKARVHVRGRARQNAPAASNRPPNIISVMHVLVKSTEGWQLVSRQATRPPAPKPTP
jgi:ketosteroid isomerase-like protein